MMLEDYLDKGILFDIICICESFVTDNSLSLVSLPGYQCFHKNREERQGGGLLIFVKIR